jgi:hypothetical protein
MPDETVVSEELSSWLRQRAVEYLNDHASGVHRNHYGKVAYRDRTEAYERMSVLRNLPYYTDRDGVLNVYICPVCLLNGTSAWYIGHARVLDKTRMYKDEDMLHQAHTGLEKFKRRSLAQGQLVAFQAAGCQGLAVWQCPFCDGWFCGPSWKVT